jgi:acetyl esterase/lipase
MLDEDIGRRPDRGRAELLRRLWPLLAALAVLAVLMGGLFGTRYGRLAFTSAAFLPDLMVDLPFRPVTWFTSDPVRERVTIRYADGKTMPADLYRPPHGRHGAVIFVMGAPPLERDDSRLVRLADSVARAGFIMLVPFSPDLEREFIAREEPEAYVAAFEYLRRQSFVDPDRIGFIGVSVGGSLALIAASEPRISGDVDFLISFGAYYDALDTLAAVTTGSIYYGDWQEPWDPRRHTERVMAKQLIARMEDRGDRDLLSRAFVDREDVASADLASLTAAGRHAYDFLANRDPERVPELIERLPAAFLDDMRALSPSLSLDGIQAEVFILHDRGDRYIPYVESRRLRDRLAGHPNLHYTELTVFEHVEPNSGKGALALFLDGSRLYFRLYQLLLRLS